MDDWTTYDACLRSVESIGGIVPLDELDYAAELSRLHERAEVYAVLRTFDALARNCKRTA